MESGASSALVCQFLCIVAINDFPMSEKGVMTERMFVSVCECLMFLMIKCIGYA